MISQEHFYYLFSLTLDNDKFLSDIFQFIYRKRRFLINTPVQRQSSGLIHLLGSSKCTQKDIKLKQNKKKNPKHPSYPISSTFLKLSL